jgi:hypothetical protein
MNPAGATSGSNKVGQWFQSNSNIVWGIKAREHFLQRNCLGRGASYRGGSSEKVHPRIPTPPLRKDHPGSGGRCVFPRGRFGCARTELGGDPLRWLVGHDARSRPRCGKSRPVPSPMAGRGAYAIRALPDLCGGIVSERLVSTRLPH